MVCEPLLPCCGVLCEPDEPCGVPLGLAPELLVCEGELPVEFVNELLVEFVSDELPVAALDPD